jgi:hypothetical protein
MTICTGFGARLEGYCKIYMAGLVSSNTTCDAIDMDEMDGKNAIHSLYREIKKLIKRELSASEILDPRNSLVETWQ